MHSIIIIDTDNNFFEEVKRKISNSSISSKDSIIYLNNEIQLKKLNFEKYKINDLIILANYDLTTKELVEKFINQYELNYFYETISLVIYTDIEVKYIPDIMFSDKVQSLLFYKEKDFRLISKLNKVIIAKKNCNFSVKNRNILTKEQYVSEAICKIVDNKKLIGYRYLYECCILYITNPNRMTETFKTIFEEVGEICNADFETVDRSIRNFVKKGVSRDNLREFIQYTKIDISTYKPANSNIIFSIVLGYQNMTINVENKDL